MNAGLTKIVGQAGKVIGNALQQAQQNADLPSRHSRVREAGLGQSGNPVTQRGFMDPGSRRGDGAVADGKTITLSDAAIAANRRTVDALARRTTVGDLPRFTVDAINTDGTKAVHEVADLIGQVRERDPEQARELLEMTMQNLAPVQRQSLAETVRENTVPNTQDDESVSDMPSYALLAEDGTEPSEPEEPSNPSDPEEPTDPSEPKEPKEDPCEDIRDDVENLQEEIGAVTAEKERIQGIISANEEQIEVLKAQIASKVDTRDAIDSVGGLSLGRLTPYIMGLGYAYRIDGLNEGEDNDLISRWESEIGALRTEIEALSADLDELSAQERRLTEKLDEAENRLAACQNAQRSED